MRQSCRTRSREEGWNWNAQISALKELRTSNQNSRKSMRDLNLSWSVSMALMLRSTRTLTTWSTSWTCITWRTVNEEQSKSRWSRSWRISTWRIRRMRSSKTMVVNRTRPSSMRCAKLRPDLEQRASTRRLREAWNPTMKSQMTMRREKKMVTLAMTRTMMTMMRVITTSDR